MGVDFRNGTYRRRVRLGKRTVKDGEAVVIWDRNGISREVIGPKLVTWIWFSTIRFLDRHVANERQYIAVEFTNGKIEHRKGPDVVWENPVKHNSVTVHDAIQLLTEKDYIVILNQKDPSQKMRVEHGPKLYFPKEHEVCHQLEWTVAVNGSQPKTEPFEILRVSNRTFEPSIPMGGNVHVTFAIQYSIETGDNDENLVRMVTSFSDPTGTMLDALRSDAISLGSVETLVNDDNLSSLRSRLPRLFGESTGMGITLESVRVMMIQGSVDSKRLLENKVKFQAGAGDPTDITDNKKRSEADLRDKRTIDTINFLKELKALDVNLTDVVCTALKTSSSENERQFDALKTLANNVAAAFNTGSNVHDD
jgi:hypothetical protein